VLVLRHKLRKPRGTPPLPGPLLSARVPPRPAALVAAFLEHIGSRPGTWEGVLPPHLFPQWAFALLSRALEGLPYSPLALLNGGCHMTVNRPMPMGEAIDLEAQLVRVDDTGRLAVITERLVTGTANAPQALEVDFFPVARLPGKGRDAARPESKERPGVPARASEIGRWSLGPRAGLEFALLTGDFNPIHWIRPAARAAGFESTILHGFAVMSRAIEALVAGDGARLGELEVRFRKPLVLPAEVGAFVDGDAIYVGERPGAEAYMTGRFGLR
jgi:acyl dehydratase